MEEHHPSVSRLIRLLSRAPRAPIRFKKNNNLKPYNYSRNTSNTSTQIKKSRESQFDGFTKGSQSFEQTSRKSKGEQTNPTSIREQTPQ